MKRLLQKLFNKPNNNHTIIIVSGLPRSGTSMMMKMLEAGGIAPLTDEIRAADADNPQGYYEFERVKKLDKGDSAWLNEAQGKSVKIISALLKHLPQTGYTYKIIFMRRNIDEILASQKQMLIRRGEATDRVSDEELAGLLAKHLNHVESWMRKQPNTDFIYTNYNSLLENPHEQIETINRFLGDTLNTQAMASVVDRRLHRQRA